MGSTGGVASVHVEGYEQLMPIFIGVAEAAALVYASTGGEGRRPSTLGTWKRSLEVSLYTSATLASQLVQSRLAAAQADRLSSLDHSCTLASIQPSCIESG